MTEQHQKMLIEAIDKDVAWYRKNSATASIEKLLLISDKLATYSYTLTEIVASKAGRYLTTYFDRKLLFAGSKIAIIDKGETAAKAEQIATLNISEVKAAEIESEVSYMESRMKLKQLNTMLSSITQRIAYARKEKEHSDYINNQK